MRPLPACARGSPASEASDREVDAGGEGWQGMAGRRAMRPSAGGGGGGGMARGLAAAAARASSPAASFLLAAAAAAALVGALYFWVVVASFCLPERGATGCLPDGEGSWAIEMYYGNSPLQLRPIELEGRSNANSSAWPVANPVLTCATATEAGYPSNFVADPFLYVQGDTLFLFFETKTTTTMHGDIAVARSSDQGATWEFLGIALDEAWHLSYPFVFKYENEIYMMPEGNKKKDLRLYRATKFPLEWTLEKVLINKPLIDAALIQFEGIWRLQEQLVTDLLDIGSDVNPSYIIFSQVQITLERGIPALIGSFASKQLPYPYLSFDMVHCAKCNVDWDKNGDGQGHQAEEVDKVTKPRRWTMSPSRGATLRICHSLAVGEGAGWTQWRKRWRSDQWQGILPHPCTMLYLCTVNAHSIPRKKCLCCKGLSGHIIRCNSCEPKLRGFI